jgi:signal transduction histidine kinase
MVGGARARFREFHRLVTQSLSGRLLLLTLLYLLLTETLLFEPSVGRYHRQLLDEHIQSAELAILPFTEPGGDSLSENMRAQLLKRAGAAAVVLKRADQKQFFLVETTPQWIDSTIDLGGAASFANMFDALDCLFRGGRRTLHVIAPTQIKGAQSIEIFLGEAPIYIALVHYAERELLSSLFLSFTTAVLVFTSLYVVLVRPMSNFTRAMIAFRENPEDAARIVKASTRRDEIGIAERELQGMQRDIFGFLQQKTRLAALGSAIARIQHDLKNILASAQLASDRLTAIEDPLVKRLTPRLVASLDRAVALATSTLRYGRAEERVPERRNIALKPLIEEAGESVVAGSDDRVRFVDGIDPELTVDADPEQLYRMILNLVRNAAEALAAAGGEIRVSAERRDGTVALDIRDTGPGIPETMQERLFQPFSGTTRAGGSGLGLAIARDLARGHGGDITLIATGATGTHFRISIPDLSA